MARAMRHGGEILAGLGVEPAFPGRPDLDVTHFETGPGTNFAPKA
jgi:hypothetical protein